MLHLISGIVIAYAVNCLCPGIGTDFSVGKKEGTWTSVLHDSCIQSCELDVRSLNHSNWTSRAQAMVHLISGIVIA